MCNKQKIIEIFFNNVRGKCPNASNKNKKHDGSGGHWLEEQFGIKHNADNKPDLWGYELKNETTSKTTFGDWSANRYIYNEKEYRHIFKGNKAVERRDSFLRMFGKPNKDKNGRYSWSGEPCPKIDKYNKFGQKLVITKDKDILAIYSYTKDSRKDKEYIIPEELRVDDLIIAKWFGKESPSKRRSDKCLKEKLEDKFNNKGWFTCKKNDKGEYYKICFGGTFNYDKWIDLVKEGIVFFDSGMYQGNDRPYSQWRANNKYWDSLIIEEYK